MTPPEAPKLFDAPPSDDGGNARPDFIEVRGTLFRTADYDTPVWSRENSSSGRWHRTEWGVSVQYWSYAPDTAWAESLRAQGVRDPADVGLMRTRIWAGQFCLDDIADLTDDAWLTWLELTSEELIANDWRPCQEAAERLRLCGAGGLVTPSAALPDRLNLVVFRSMVRGDWHETPSGPKILRYPDLIVPCRHVATGHPFPELAHSVAHW